MADDIAKSLSKDQLISVLRRTQAILQNPANDFVLSGWRNAKEAVADIESHIARIQAEDRSKLFELRLLYAPTGNIQEVSVSSGWGSSFLVLAERFDKALEQFKADRC